MNIEIKKLSFKDYVISRVEMEKIKLLIQISWNIARYQKNFRETHMCA